MASCRDHHELATVDLVGHGNRIGGGGELFRPEFFAGGGIKGPELPVRGGADKHQSALRDVSVHQLQFGVSSPGRTFSSLFRLAHP